MHSHSNPPAHEQAEPSRLKQQIKALISLPEQRIALRTARLRILGFLQLILP